MIPILYRIPLLGWMLRDAFEGHEDAPLWFALNVIMLWILSVIVFGWAGLIVPALLGDHRRALRGRGARRRRRKDRLHHVASPHLEPHPPGSAAGPGWGPRCGELCDVAYSADPDLPGAERLRLARAGRLARDRPHQAGRGPAGLRAAARHVPDAGLRRRLNGGPDARAPRPPLRLPLRPPLRLPPRPPLRPPPRPAAHGGPAGGPLRTRRASALALPPPPRQIARTESERGSE